MSPNKSEVTHILCGAQWQEAASQERIKKIEAELNRMNNKNKNKNHEKKAIQLVTF